MSQLGTKRIESLDILKGFVMVIMALDHTRDYFHYDAYLFDVTDPLKTNTILFFTRWVTHFCAPAFCFLAGISAFLVGKRKSKKELSSFLLKRGIWLVFIEITIVTFGWTFNIHFQSIGLQVIWSLGISMIFLAAIIHLPMKYILILSLIIVLGHNLLDYINIENSSLWNMIHHRGPFYVTESLNIRISYPIIPWIGVMSLGYYFGTFYISTFDPGKRQKIFVQIGFFAIILFIVLRFINQYGNPNHWEIFNGILPTVYSFMNPSKYPPSVTYLLMTLGPTVLFMGTTENVKGKVANFFIFFGRVPFFYYILHIYLIHLFAMILAQLTGFGWEAMILDGFVIKQGQLVGYGVNLCFTYLIWILVIILLYPLCKKFSQYKMDHKEKQWLSYL